MARRLLAEASHQGDIASPVQGPAVILELEEILVVVAAAAEVSFDPALSGRPLLTLCLLIN